MIKKDISIIIPCFNTNPEFIQEALNSVKSYTGKFSYTIIIVDDGSTDASTLLLLQQIEDDTIKIIFETNRGPAAARNTGTCNADSEFILFLDSDDRLLPAYIEEGLTALKANTKAGVVYSNAHAFGDASRKNFLSKPFDIAELLIRNYIPMCSVIRRKAWEDVGGIDENLIQYEDWEFWINIYKAGWEFIYIDKQLFEYRIQETSLIAQLPEESFKKAAAYIYKKHYDLVYQVFHQLYATRIIYWNDMRQPFRSFIKYIKNNFTKNRTN